MRAKRKLKVLVLAHEELIPPSSLNGVSSSFLIKCKTERDVIAALGNLGHEVIPIGVHGELNILKEALIRHAPHVVFNLLEEFHGNALYDQHIVSTFELLRQPYTGCNPRGLMLAHDKALSKKVLAYHQIPVPRFAVFRLGKEISIPNDLPFPLLVKSQIEEGSLGISQKSVVYDRRALKDRIKFIHRRLGTHAIAEQYIDGREIYVSLIGNRGLRVYPIWELSASNLSARSEFIATDRMKWDEQYQKRNRVVSAVAKNLNSKVQRQLIEYSKAAYRALGLSGYARIDFRLDAEGVPYFLEANPNPNIASDEDFARAAQACGISYPKLIQKIVSLGESYLALDEEELLSVAL